MKKVLFQAHSEECLPSQSLFKGKICNILLHAYKELISTSYAPNILSDILFVSFPQSLKVGSAYKFGIDL